MEQYDPSVIREFYRRGKLAYYVLNGIMYAGTFPKTWARDHAPETGPKDCENCRENGCWNGVFMLYCANCAIRVYEGTRGKGASGPGEEFDIPKNRGFDSAFDTYLYNINLNDVGDPDIHDTLGHRMNAYFDKFNRFNPRAVLAGLKRLDGELRDDDDDDDDDDGESKEYVEYFIDTNGTPNPMTDYHDDKSVDDVDERDDDAYDTGHGVCQSCVQNGEWNGAFMNSFDCSRKPPMLCADCAIRVYEGTQGKGASGPDISDNNENVAEAGPSAFDWDESGRRRFYGMGYDEYRMNYDSDDDDEYDRRRNCRDSRTVCYESDDEHTQHRYQQYIPSKGECVPTPMSEYDREEVEKPDTFIHYGTGKSWNESVKHQFEYGTDYTGELPAVMNSGDVRRISKEFEDIGLSMSEDDFDYIWNFCAAERASSLNTQESVPEPDMPFESDSESESCAFSEREPELDEAVHCMICENTKFTCACDEDLIHQSVFCYTCENPRYICSCNEESRNQTHYCLHCTKVKYQCICVGENSVYLRVARKYCMQQSRVPDDEEEEEI